MNTDTHTQFFAVFENSETGMRSHVTRGPNGYHVSTVDLDSGNYLPEVRIFPLHMFDAAITYAEKMVGA